MNAWKQFGVWLVICAACAGLTIAAVNALDRPLGLQKTVSHFNH